MLKLLAVHVKVDIFTLKVEAAWPSSMLISCPITT